MSKKNKKKVNDSVNNDVKAENTNVEGEQKDMKEKKGFFYGVGHVAGVVVNTVSKAVTSTPGKIATGAVVVAAAVAGGYAAGKHRNDSAEDTCDQTSDGDFAEVDATSDTDEN